MSYQVLARKWRPQNFEQMVGQQHVLQALMNALTQNRLHHAYLFTGTRGVGKTTVARVFAKSLNCESGVTAYPCGTCANCQAIEKGCFVDLIEVDAASRTSVEDTRQLLENVQYAATVGRYKIYLIDEVHMLSGHSFNALLKTLEEPPQHVKFLLATTDPQKLPVTVLSRCLQFHLKNMLPEQIAEHLDYILREEQINFETPALQQIARAASGSMRDALSLLDQAIAYANGQLTAMAVSQMLGTIEQTHIHNILQQLAANNPQALITQITQLAEQGVDFHVVLEDIISELHQIALQQAVPTLVMPPMIQQLAQSLAKEDVQLWYQIALTGRRDLPLAPSAKIGFEMVVLRMLAFRPAPPENHVTKQIESSSDRARTVAAQSEPVVVRQDEKNIVQPSQTQILGDKTPDWPTLLTQLNLSGPALALASHCSCDNTHTNPLAMILDQRYKALLNDERQTQIAQAISQSLGKATEIIIRIGQTSETTPAQLASERANTKQQVAQQIVDNDPHVQEIMQKFGASISAIAPANTDSS